MNHCSSFHFTCVLCLVIINIISISPQKPEKIFPSKSTVSKRETFEKSPPKVQLKNGLKINGRVDHTIGEGKTYYSFRGIPFAKPPVGKLRFKPPVPLSGDFSGQTLNAFHDGVPCVNVSDSISVSEDCLYLNIYTPQFPGRNSSFLPVMVWVYGGAFVNGDGSYTTFGPDFFLEDQSVMIVTFNYREGIFGYISTDDEVAPGNYGLKDILLALQWVQENIEQFGGNPKLVTAFGQSAGAASISYLSQTPLAEGLFHRAILQSGTTLNLWALSNNSKSATLEIGKLCGVNMTNSQTLVDGLREIDYRTLQFLQTIVGYKDTIFENVLNGLPFGPTFEAPHLGAILVNRTHEQLKNGLFHRIPYMIGFTSMEIKTILDYTSLRSTLREIFGAVLWIIPCRLVKRLFALGLTFVPNFNLATVIFRWLLRLKPKESVPASLNAYENAMKDIADAISSQYSYFSGKRLADFLNDNEFNRGILEAARLYSRWSPVYLYRFSYEGDLASGGDGVGHGDDLLYMWRWRDSYDENPISLADSIIRKKLIRLWTNFAKTGNPTPDADPVLGNVKWPLTNTGKSLTFLDIGPNLTINDTSDWVDERFWENLFYRYGNPPYSTY